MILNNYFNFIGNSARYLPDASGSSATANIGLIDTSGDSVAWEYGSANSVDGIVRLVNNYVAWKDNSVILSGDSSEPTASDYSVTNDLSSAISATITITSGADSGKATLTCTISGTNTSGTSQTINQICVAKNVTTNISTATVLFVKHKLDTPISLAAGESFTKTFAWELS